MRGLRRYVRECQRRLNLSEWVVDIEISTTPSKQDAEHAAEIDCLEQYKRATLELFPIARTLSPEGFRDIIAHELTHLFFARVDSLVTRSGKDLTPPHRKLLLDVYANAEEEAVERISRHLATRLPPWRGKL